MIGPVMALEESARVAESFAQAARADWAGRRPCSRRPAAARPRPRPQRPIPGAARPPVPGEPARSSSGPVRISTWPGDRLGPLVAGAVLGHHQRRTASTAPSPPLGRRHPPRLRGPGPLRRRKGSDLPLRRRSCRLGCLHDTARHWPRGIWPGPRRAAGALDSDQGEVPEPAQPGQQARQYLAALAGNSRVPSDPPEQGSAPRRRAPRSRVFTPPVMAPRLRRWSLPSLSQVEGWHAPAGPSCEDRQIQTATPVVTRAWGPGGQIDRRDNQQASADS